MERNLFDTLAGAIEDIEDREGEHDVVLLPPANHPYASDEGVGDDDIGFNGNLDLPADVAGAVEIQGVESSDSETDDEIDEDPKKHWPCAISFCFISIYVNHIKLSCKMITFYLFLSFECFFSV